MLTRRQTRYISNKVKFHLNLSRSTLNQSPPTYSDIPLKAVINVTPRTFVIRVANRGQ